MIGRLLSLIPAWPWALIVGALLAGVAAWSDHRGYTRADTAWSLKWQAQELALVRAHDRALADEITRGNAMQKDLDDVHQRSQQYRQAIEQHAQAAASAGDRAGRAERRLRDAAATHAIATRAALDAAGAAGQCAPAAAAADLHAELLGGLAEAAGRLRAAAGAVGRHADDAWGAAAECAAGYDAVRRRLQEAAVTK